ncbi:uncharacterized protein LOC143286831 isoform X2 [Babylonia areolata]|uniref:uncharacterized protein LOC143286831 isoform X2 n=1 Tax=Babylonia areolata TaxID=304850 RepID=UPI003FD6788B
MSSRATKRFTPFIWRLSFIFRCSSSSSALGSKDGLKPKQSAESRASPALTPKQPEPEVKFDNKKYQAGQLFEYNNMSFYDMELDMSPARCPQPSSLKKSL